MKKKNIMTLGIISTATVGIILSSTLLGSGVLKTRAGTNSTCGSIIFSENIDEMHTSYFDDITSKEDLDLVATYENFQGASDFTLTDWNYSYYFSNNLTTHYAIRIGYYDGAYALGSMKINLLSRKCTSVTIYAKRWDPVGQSSASVLLVSKSVSGSQVLSNEYEKYVFSFGSSEQSSITINNGGTEGAGNIAISKISILYN